MIHDIIPAKNRTVHSQKFHSSHPGRSMVMVRRTTIRRSSVSPDVYAEFMAPTPMIKPVEHLSPFDKVLVFENALLRARYELRAEGKKWRHLTLRAVR